MAAVSEQSKGVLENTKAIPGGVLARHGIVECGLASEPGDQRATERRSGRARAWGGRNN